MVAFSQCLSEFTDLCSLSHQRGFVMRSAAEVVFVYAEVISPEHVAAA